MYCERVEGISLNKNIEQTKEVVVAKSIDQPRIEIEIKCEKSIKENMDNLIFLE